MAKKSKPVFGERLYYAGLPYCDRCGIRQELRGTVGASMGSEGVRLVSFGEICGYCRTELEHRGWELNP